MTALTVPDIEGALITLVESATSVDAGTRRTQAAEFVRVNLTGGTLGTLVTGDATVLFECWAATSLRAFEIAQGVWAAVRNSGGAFVGPVWFVKADPQMPVNFPDPDTKSPRYQFLATVRVALEEVA